MYLISKRFADGRMGYVVPLTFDRARLAIGNWDGFDDIWCYDSPAEAIAALEAWDGTGEPEGWMRHPPSGRRRPRGNPAAEYIRP